MGIRIHKSLGYGLDDVKVKKYNIVDNRFNPQGFFKTDYEEREERWSVKKYLEWLESNVDNADELDIWKKSRLHVREFEYSMEIKDAKQAIKDRIDFNDCFVHCCEYGMPRVLCIAPLANAGRRREGRSSWQRYDDNIDYYEEIYVKNYHNAKNWVKVFDDGIYPYSASYWDNRDGRPIEATFACAFRRLLNSKEYKKGKIPGETLQALAKPCGFENYNEAINHMTPIVPYSIQLMLKYCEAFSDSKTILTLKPMMYCRWG